MSQQRPPTEYESRRDILDAIRRVDWLSDLVSTTGEHFDYEIDLEVIVYGRNYKGKPVGPYVKLLSYAPGTAIINEGDWSDNDFYIIVEGQVEKSGKGHRESTRSERLGAGDQFGARSMLAGGPGLATVKTPRNCSVRVLKIQRPAVRLLRKLPKFADKLDYVCREHGKETTLEDFISRAGLSSDLKGDLQAVSSFKAYSKSHVLFTEGSPISRLFYIAEGWVSRSTTMASVKTRDFLGKGYCLGIEGASGIANYPYTVTVMGHTQVLEINIIQLRQNKVLAKALRSALGRFTPADLKVETERPLIRERIVSSQERLITTGVVDANNLLIMDMDLCVRCGNCSMACEKVHGRSRLIRRGTHITRLEPLKPKRFQSLLAPAACMHCKDPECLTGCPTGAISRLAGGQIDIAPDLCIGCGDCATQCPYDAIFMVHCDEPDQAKVGKPTMWTLLGLASEPAPQPVTGIENLLAIKCNLCSDRTRLNPPGSKSQVYSCEENCPTGALARVVPDQYFSEAGEIENLRMLDPTHAYGRNIHQRDSTKRWVHFAGIFLFVLLGAVTIEGLKVYGYGQRLPGLPNLRWITGVAGLIALMGAGAYQLRRKVYDRRRWPLRYWMLVHCYLGLIACFIILLHGSTLSGGWLTTVLMVSFDVAIFTGVIGLVIYQVAPRLLTRIEGTPLLLDDLKARRDELQEELERVSNVSEHLRLLVNEEVLPTLASGISTIRQFIKQESVDDLVDSANQQFETVAKDLSSIQERSAFDEAVRAAALLPRINALIHLHKLLKAWLVPHIASVYVMAALMVVHIVQVVYWSW